MLPSSLIRMVSRVGWLLPLVLLVAASGCSDENEQVDGDSDLVPADEETFEQTNPDGDVDETELDSDGDADLDEMEGEGAGESEGEVEHEEVDVFANGCNGFDVLCDRRFDQVAYATTHNAMSNQADGWVAPNQTYGLRRQLDDGIRAMMIDSYEYEDDAYLCHGDCLFGSIKLVEALGILNDFLDAHPAEVLTLIFEDYLGFEKTAAAFTESGLAQRVYHHDAEIGWPTLRDMIAADRRVVVLSDTGADDDGWYLRLFDHCFETDWANKKPEDFSCDDNRGDPDNALFILNHFLTNPLASSTLAEQVNHNPFFQERAQSCRDRYSRILNFVTVDFYDIGDVLAVTDSLNGVGE